MAFFVGQPVRCVDATPGSLSKCDDLIEGASYTVVRTGKTSLGFPAVGVDRGRPGLWRADRFRPLTDTKQQTSFTEGAPKDSERWDNRKKQRVLT